MEKETRKCSICKNDIDITTNFNDFFIDGTSYKHVSCFIEYKINQKRNPWTLEQCNEYISKLQISTKKLIEEKTIRKKVTDWIFETYGVTYLPNHFYIKLNEIYKGIYKQTSRPVLPEDLLDMWQRKIDYLNKVALKNKSKGNSMDQYGRINYDLAILLGKYDGYLNWKEEQRIIKEKILEEQVTYNKINYKQIENTNNKKNSDDKQINISLILDEI